MSAKPRLVFVYNADTGLFNTMADIGHKIFSPSTYECDLCALTHGWFSERKQWRGFVESLDAECEFLHRDQFHERFPGREDGLPAVFRLDGDALTLCMDAEALGRCEGLDELQRAIKQGCIDG